MKKENKEHNLFMHSQVPEVEPEDTDTIHPDYKDLPINSESTGITHPPIEGDWWKKPILGIPMVANIPFKEPGPEAYDTPQIQYINPAPLPDIIEGPGYAGHRHKNLDFEQAMKLAQYYGGNIIEETEEGKKNMAKLHDTGLLQELLDYKPKPKAIIGVDPGKSGGIIAIVDEQIVGKWITPLSGDKVDLGALYAIFNELKSKYTITVVLEEVHSVFGSSAESNFVFGFVCGAIEAIVIANHLRLNKVQPKEWQSEIWQNGDKVYKVKKPDQKKAPIDTKATSLNAAKRLFPGFDFRKSDSIRVVKDHDGLIDAACLAEMGRRKNW